jgi:hypothetical protein
MSLRTWIVSAFTDNLALKASSLLLAMALWFVVGAREPTEDLATVRFVPQLDSALVLRDPTPPIRALVVGRPSEILKLSNTPLVIRRPIPGDAPDTLEIPLRASDIEIPEGVEVIVREVQPRALTLRFETTASRRVPVRSSLTIPAEVVGRARVLFDPDSVTVMGPRRIVRTLATVSTVRDSVGLDSIPRLVDLDTSGLGVVVRPPQVKALVRRTRP